MTEIELWQNLCREVANHEYAKSKYQQNSVAQSRSPVFLEPAIPPSHGFWQVSAKILPRKLLFTRCCSIRCKGRIGKTAFFLDGQGCLEVDGPVRLIFFTNTGQYSRSMFPPARLAKSRP